MKAYLHFAEVCERAAAAAPDPDTKAGMLASAAVWRRLAVETNPAAKVTIHARQDRPTEQVMH